MPVSKEFRDSPFYHGVQGDKERASDEARQTAPWTHDQLVKVKDAAKALMRTRTSVDLPGKKTLSAFDGHALWDLMGALERVREFD